MQLKTKKCKLGELVGTRNQQGQKELYKKMYRNINEWDKVYQITTQVIRPMDEIIKTHDDKLKQFLDDIKKDQSKTQEIDAAYLAMLNTEIEFKLAVLSEEDAKQAGLNPNELAAIWDFVDFEKPKKEKK